MNRRLTIHRQRFPIQGTFRIARGAKSEALVVVARIEEDDHAGWGECVPYARYGESVAEVVATLESLADEVAAGLDRDELAHRLPPGAARNALDCALWDVEAKRTRVPVWKAAGLHAAPEPLTTAFTLSLGAPAEMAQAARAAVAADRPLLKLKLTGEGDLERVEAVRQAAPQARLIADANEGWTLDQLRRFAPAFAALGVALIEQPLPADADEALRGYKSPVPLAADETCRGLDSLARLSGLYQVVNIKLDKTGGLTEALAVKAAAVGLGLEVMVGCMVSSSLAMAPALLLAQGVAFVDLDGPLLLAADRQPGLVYDGARVHPADPELWG